MATHIMQAMYTGPTMEERTQLRRRKPLPSLPSPTLTNPDMVLPNGLPLSIPSPPRIPRPDRPPSPSYLREQTNDAGRARPGSANSSGAGAGKKEKRGLMSRKMMLLRSRTASGQNVKAVGNGNTPRSIQSSSDGRPSADYTYASSPTLMDVGNLAPEQPEQGRPSTDGSSFASDDMSGLPEFLAKYDIPAGAGTDDELESVSPAPQNYGYGESVEDGLDAERRQKEEDEQNSAILSKRAEEILANAKKRLNLMEGNLRGARNLVAPLTAANLKRATSSAASYGTRGRDIYNGNNDHSPSRKPYRALHAQASSPTMGHDFHQGDWRDFSEIEIPERPYTAMERTNSPVRALETANSSTRTLERTNSPIRAIGRIPVKAHDMQWTNTLRGSRSYDSLGSSAMGRPYSRDPLYCKGSPDSNLGPLVEDDGPYYHASSYDDRGQSEQQDGLGISRSPSRTEDLREQMSSLKGKISTLKERAREDSLRRQSMQSLREPSPLNNASAAAPEFFYTSSQAYGGPVLDTNAGVGYSSQNNSPATPQSVPKLWEPSQVMTGSRNAFAEQAQRRQQLERGSDEGSGRSTQNSRRQNGVQHNGQQQAPTHRRTRSGTAIVQSSKHRYSHHQPNNSREMPGAFVDDDDDDDYVGEPSPGEESDEMNAIPQAQLHARSNSYNSERSKTGASVYEDAETEQQSSVVAHEDREDAFDYEHFFLHSAMGTYGHGGRPRSTSSEDSVSSVETARAPQLPGEEDGYDEFNNEAVDALVPPSPETPERLKEIERNLHKRTFSDESTSSLATFATATEGLESVPTSKRNSTLEWPIRPPSENRSRPNSRPSTAIPIKQRPTLSDSSSERADSGIGLPRRSLSNHDSKRPLPGSLTKKSSLSGLAARTTHPISPPLSPRAVVTQDPATVAVNAMLETNGRQLGLKDKALMFSLIESLRKVCNKLQEQDEADYESQVLRRRLDEARKALDGVADQRPGTS